MDVDLGRKVGRSVEKRVGGWVGKKRRRGMVRVLEKSGGKWEGWCEEMGGD